MPLGPLLERRTDNGKSTSREAVATATSQAGATPGDLAELRAIVDSVRITGN